MSIGRSHETLFGSKRTRFKRKADQERTSQRRLLLEKLEDRRLLAAGPRLAGIQPNNSVLFSVEDPSANVRSVAPRELNIRFDEDQRIDATTLNAIRITRSGLDGLFGSADDQIVTPGFIGVAAAPDENEVVVRFAETLPDDVYRVEIFGAGSANPLKNLRNEDFVAASNDGDGDSAKDTIEFTLDLGAQVVAVVPQPITRLNTGAISQARNQIEVYFNDDDLFVENDDLGNPTARSAENPDFYQLIFTASSVRNTDDVVVKPIDVAYDAATDRVVLTFAQNLDMLQHPDTGAVIGPGTFRLRIGTTEAAPLEPLHLSPAVTISSDFNSNNEAVLQFTAVRPDEQDIDVVVSRTALGTRAAGAPALRVNVVANVVFLDLNSQAGQEATAQEVIEAINSHPVARELIVASLNSGSTSAKVGNRTINYSPLRLTGVGSSYNTATDLSDNTDLGAALVITGSGTTFQDGSFFHITDSAGQTRKFEFDANEPPVVNDPTAIRIPFSSSLTQAQVTNVIATAINTASFGVSATIAGNLLRLEGDRFVDLGNGVAGLREEFQNKFNDGQVVSVILGGNDFRGGVGNADTFTIVDDTGATHRFEFDSGFALTVPTSGAGIANGEQFIIRFNDAMTPVEVVFEFEDTAIADGLIGGAGTVPIDFTVADSQQTLAAAIVRAIRSKVDDGTLTGIQPVYTANGEIHLGGSSLHEVLTRFVVNVPVDGMAITNGDTFEIRFNDQLNAPTVVRFEYDDIAINDGVVGGNVKISFNKSDDRATLANAISAAIQTKIDDTTLAGVTQQVSLDNTRVVLSGTSFHSVSQPGPVGVGLTGLPGPQLAGAFAIPLVPDVSFTSTEIARSIAQSVNQNLAGVGVTATARGNQISFSGERSIEGLGLVAGLQETIQARFDAGPVMVVKTAAVNSLPDGSKIVIRDDRGTSRVFEVDRDLARNLTDPTASRIALNGTEDVEQIAQKVVDAINAAGFRVTATALRDRIYLTNDRDVQIDRLAKALEATSQSLIISSEISARPFLLDLPGGSDEPGHRDFPAEVGQGIEQHINTQFGKNGHDETPGVTTVLYNFQQVYGVDSQNVPLNNAITGQQKLRAREAFQLWGNYLGVQFLETASDGLTIVTGDLNVIDPALPDVLEFAANQFRVRIDPLFADGMLVMDSAFQWNEDLGGDWFLNTMVGIGSMLGLDLANDLSPTELMARFTAPLDPLTLQNTPYFNAPDPEPIFPGNADILHGQQLYRPDGVDVDLYRFQVDLDPGRRGLVTAETFAERLPNSSLLNTVLSLYRENEDGTRELIARNDDYYSRDSYLELELEAGVYYIGVSASGNTGFDPTIDNTGFGGTSQGKYDLRLNFRSRVDAEDAIRDADGAPTLLDGDADGTPGGVYDFWFQTQPLNRVLTITGSGASFVDGQVLTLTNNQGLVRRFEFDSSPDSSPTVSPGNIRLKFTPTTTPETIASLLVTKIRDPLNGFGTTMVANVNADNLKQVILGSADGQSASERAVSLSNGFVGVEIKGRTIFVDKLAGPNADGSLARPFNSIAKAGVPNAFAAAKPNDIVRIVGNGGTDSNIDTIGDNFAYEIGVGALAGQLLEDGTEMSVPKGVTVMVDPGSIFKMRRSRIGVGSSSLTVDRSGGALQVLGTPDRNVIFTSWFDESIGRDTHQPRTTPARGDWGGIVLRSDVDRSESRSSLEDQGIFLNYINHADIRYGGGGGVVIDGIQQVVRPVQIIQTRPTVTFNRITQSADAPISATPNSFEETNFHSPQYQSAGEFTSDYDRVGPDFSFNTLLNNSTNGVFIQLDTPAVDTLRTLKVSARFDDTDIVHVLSENFVIEGSAGDPFLDLARPAVNLITFTPRTGGELTPQTYQYKVTFVDINGFEGRPSRATSSVTLTAANTAIQLNQLPPATGDFVKRRIYRTDSSQGGVYSLVAELNASDTVFVDGALAQSTILQRDPPDVDAVTSVPQTRGSLAQGTYNYRVVFVDAQGREGAASDATADVAIMGTPAEGGVALTGLPPVNGEFVSRRLYRSTVGGISPYTLAAELDASSPNYTDDGFTLGGALDPGALGVVRARPHARLAIDPGSVVKLEGARIEGDFGAQLIAEGTDGLPVIFTSRLDDTYGAGGTFDTNNDDGQANGESLPGPGNWGGIFLGHLSSGSIDHAVISYGGGITRVEGTFAGFNVIEVHQADLRLTNSIIENNAEGVGGQGPLDRFGRGYNLPATIFVRGAQPIIVDNIIRDNNTLYDPAKSAANLQMPVITINANSLIHDNLVDIGRSTGEIDRITRYGDNAGPLVRGNQLDNNALNAMVVRGEILSTQSIWDDTDIVHVLTNQFDQQDIRNGQRKWAFDEIVIPEHHTYGGLRLQSSPTESLVVKMLGAGQLNNNFNLFDDGRISNRNRYNGAGFTASGNPVGIEDRIGGSLHVIGQPGFPVVITSLHDDTVGAGVQPDDTPQTDTNNNGIATIPRPNDWRSVLLDQNSNDRNVEIITELESPDAVAPGVNATTDTSQIVGDLAPNEQSGDDNLRMGFEIHGFLNEPGDIDVYGFNAAAGTELWLDIDRTAFTLDTVIEVLDSNGNVLARSNDTLSDTGGVDFISPSLQPNLVSPLQKSPEPYVPKHASGLTKDYYSWNPLDAGLRFALPGNSGSRSTYHVRIRSNDGLTSGIYQFQIRTQEADEFPGSTVRYADIRYANNGIEVIGLPAHSPLIGEAAEDEELSGFAASNNNIDVDLNNPGRRPQDIGNLLTSDRVAIGVAGSLSANDVDFYTFDVNYESITNPNARDANHHKAAVIDVDYADALVRLNSTISVYKETTDDFGNINRNLVLIARDSNVADDRSGPLAGADLSDLSRGSVGPKDPFLGPVELPESRYYVAVTSDGQMPQELQQFTIANPPNPLVRLEPINSVRRIAEDHIGSSGGSTSAPPVVPVLFNPNFVGTGTNLWSITTNRASDPGHELNAAFDYSRSGANQSSDSEPNDTLATAQNLDNSLWSLAANPNIGNAASNNPNHSTQVPHTTINGTGNGSFDYFSFTVANAGDVGTFDIDFGDTGGPGSFDSDITLYDANGFPIRSSAISLPSSGGTGSVSFNDALIEHRFSSPGVYTIAVGRWPSFANIGGLTGSALQTGDTYQLNISLENHPLTAGVSGNQSFYFGDQSAQNRVTAGARGGLVSNPFSLKGYSAEDIPAVYFSYYLQSDDADQFRLYVVEENGTETLLASSNSSDLGNNVQELFEGTFGWRQARATLGQVAGKENLRLRFDFN
ncbi:MAG: pre-peptidase C-terminal domain-containing protein, partial [Planctomycetales bacterium]|nr:pre-peptidase C-terminal domain-containing protein [Planctomycetales bacterium]